MSYTGGTDVSDAARRAWDDSSEGQREALFRAMYVYLSIEQPFDLFSLEMEVSAD